MSHSKNHFGAPALPFKAIIWAFALITIFPFAMLVLTSFKSMPDLIQGAFVIPDKLHFENYVNAWIDGHFREYLINSVLVVIPVVAISTLFGLMMGFGFAFLSFPFKKTIFVLLTFGMMVPTEAYIIPLYYEMLYSGLLNTYAALILPQIAMSIPFATLFMASAMQQLPPDVIEAAVVDGSSRPMVIRKIIVPLLMPAISTLALFLFIWTWNEFLIPLVLVTDDSLRTLPIGMLFFQGRYTVNTPVLTAGAVMVILPLIVVYLIFQRKFIEGMTAGASK